MASGKNITLKKDNGKQYNLPYHIKFVGENIKWGRVRWDGNFGREKKLKIGLGKNIKL